jgi:hypothetical protein
MGKKRFEIVFLLGRILEVLNLYLSEAQFSTKRGQQMNAGLLAKYFFC